MDYDVTAVESAEFPSGAEYWRQFNAVAFSCLNTGICELTEENCEEWFVRYRIWNRLQGLGDYLTLEDVKKFVGLKVNHGVVLERQEWFPCLEGDVNTILDSMKKEGKE